MKVLIMGCGRVGSHLATMLDADKHTVTVLDTDAYSFRRLPAAFHGTALLGNGTDYDDLIKAGIETADTFIALTQGDNRNIMATQIAKHIFNVPRTICRIYDPLRAELYGSLGLEVICPTIIMANVFHDNLEK
jgi:trk system potassium uptake protein